MDVVRLMNKALSDEDIQRILGGDAKIIKYAELGNLYDIDCRNFWGATRSEASPRPNERYVLRTTWHMQLGTIIQNIDLLFWFPMETVPGSSWGDSGDLPVPCGPLGNFNYTTDLQTYSKVNRIVLQIHPERRPDATSRSPEVTTQNGGISQTTLWDKFWCSPPYPHPHPHPLTRFCFLGSAAWAEPFNILYHSIRVYVQLNHTEAFNMGTKAS
jgi:hypothetical protein